MCNSLGLVIRKVLFLILPSLFDLSSDILQALDLIFPGQWISCKGYVFEDYIPICLDSKDRAHFNNEANDRKMWGYISLAIMFLPGIVKAINVLHKRLNDGDYHKIPMIVMYLPYPLYMIYIQLKAILLSIAKPNINTDTSLIRALSMEAFYESFPQLVLQLYIIIYRYPFTFFTLLSMTSSFILLAKTIMTLDSSKPKFFEETSKITKIQEKTPGTVDAESKERPCCHHCHTVATEACGHIMRGMKYIFWVMPFYITSVVYKVAAFSLTIAYLRVWSIVTMLILIIELVILAKCSGLGSSWIYPVFSNFFIVNIGGASIELTKKEKNSNCFKRKEHTEEPKKKTSKEDIKRIYKLRHNFAKRAVILSFVHHTVILIAIIWLVLALGCKDLGNLIGVNEKDVREPVLKEFFVTVLNGTTKYWKKMNHWLSPPCSKNKTPCKTFYNVGDGRESTDVGQKYEELRFVVIIGSVILVGLFNLCLYIYSARDIKKKTMDLIDLGCYDTLEQTNEVEVLEARHVDNLSEKSTNRSIMVIKVFIFLPNIYCDYVVNYNTQQV